MKELRIFVTEVNLLWYKQNRTKGIIQLNYLHYYCNKMQFNCNPTSAETKCKAIFLTAYILNNGKYVAKTRRSQWYVDFQKELKFNQFLVLFFLVSWIFSNKIMEIILSKSRFNFKMWMVILNQSCALHKLSDKLYDFKNAILRNYIQLVHWKKLLKALVIGQSN